MKNIVFHCENTRDLREKYDVEESRTLVEVLEDPNCIDTKSLREFHNLISFQKSERNSARTLNYNKVTIYIPCYKNINDGTNNHE